MIHIHVLWLLHFPSSTFAIHQGSATQTYLPSLNCLFHIFLTVLGKVRKPFFQQYVLLAKEPIVLLIIYEKR